MIRKSTINLNYSNTGKKDSIINFASEYKRVVNYYIDKLWEKQKFNGNFLNKEELQVETWLTERAKQCAGKQAFQIVKSQRKKEKEKRTKPCFGGTSIELDSRFVDIQNGNNSFDTWIRLSSLGNKLRVIIPSRKHYHFNLFKDWDIQNSARLRIKNEKEIYLDVYFKKPSPEKKKEGKSIGMDCGYKKLAVFSDNHIVGKNLEEKIEKIARKKQKSKAFYRALTERNEYINLELKNMDMSDMKEIVVEDLKSVKHGTKGKIRKQFNNKLQRWVYRYFLDRLEQHCEVTGVQLHKVDPAYTSQMCSACGYIHRSNRNGELFRCRKCGYTADADFNASRNILNRFRPQEYMVPVQKTHLSIK